MSALSKTCYVLARTLSAFGLPGLRGLRTRVYRWHFRAAGMSVSDRVMVVAAHRSPSAGIAFGRGVELGADAYLDYSGGVAIGDHVAISEGAKIFTHNHVVRRGHANWHHNPIEFSPLRIEDFAWVGAGAIVLPRVRRIGCGAVVGAGAVLAEDVPDFAVYAGNPAREIFRREVQDETGIGAAQPSAATGAPASGGGDLRSSSASPSPPPSGLPAAPAAADAAHTEPR